MLCDVCDVYDVNCIYIVNVMSCNVNYMYIVNITNWRDLTGSLLFTQCTVFQDAFFYSLVYDPQQKTLLADKGEIRVGQRYQAEVKVPLVKEGTSFKEFES